MGGTCGDLVTAMIDSTDVTLTDGSIKFPSDRIRLKKPHTFASDNEKDLVVESSVYRSISSHDYDYHLRKGHKILSVGIDNTAAATWCAERFKNLHKPHVWKEMSLRCGANTIEEYAQMYMDFTNMVKTNPNATVISINDILTGNLLTTFIELGIETDSNASALYNACSETNKL
jgi:hypothetical protein